MKNIKRVNFKAADVNAENAIELSQANGIPTAGKAERDGKQQAAYIKGRFNKGTLIADSEAPVMSEVNPGQRVKKPHAGSNAEQVLEMVKQLQAQGCEDPAEMAKAVKAELGLKQIGTAKKYVAVSVERAAAHW